MNKRIMTAAAAAVLIGTGAAVFGSGEASGPVIEYRYEVEPGDTVYNIAATVATPEEDINRLTWQICQDNGIRGGLIQPGQVLTIRVPQAEK